MEKRIHVLVGASGSGKSTLGKYLKGKGVPEIVSHSTRKPRKGEVNGVDYYFVKKEEFDSIEKIEQVCYAGNYYCVSKMEVDRKLAEYGNVFVITDINGVKQLKKQYGDIVNVIFIKISLIRMAYRMFKRGDKINKIIERIKHCVSNRELSNGKYAHFIIKNNNLNKAIKQISKIVLRK